MVNKAVVGVIGVILITTLGVGALVGLQGGGGNGADDGNANGNGGGDTGTPQVTATVTPNGTMGDGTTGNGPPTLAPEDRTPIPPREFNKQAIEQNVTQKLDQWRRSQGLQPLVHTGNTADRTASMARNHSITMADEGSAAHVIDGVDTTARYRNHDLFGACQYQSSEGYIAQPGREGGRNKQFEHVTSTVAGGQYETVNGTRFTADDEDVAEAIVSEFERRSGQEDGILAPNMNRVGVGVEITRTGAVYATVHLCG